MCVTMKYIFSMLSTTYSFTSLSLTTRPMYQLRYFTDGNSSKKISGQGTRMTNNSINIAAYTYDQRKGSLFLENILNSRTLFDSDSFVTISRKEEDNLKAKSRYNPSFYSYPDRPFHNARASRSGDRRDLCISETSSD